MNKLKGGLADLMDPSDFDLVQLTKGIEVESEHTDDPVLAKEIAMDHLVEDPEYYIKLDKMENPVEKMIRDVVDGDDPDDVVDDEVASGDSQYNEDDEDDEESNILTQI